MATKTVTERQVSAGAVAYRRRGAAIDVALISVGVPARWQLPKGMVDPGETPEQAARREVREEAGIEGDIRAPLDTIEYWYQATRDGQRVRYHKFVHFFLIEHRAGDVADHDQEVNEARWVPLPEAATLLSFASERRVLDRAAGLLSP